MQPIRSRRTPRQTSPQDAVPPAPSRRWMSVDEMLKRAEEAQEGPARTSWKPAFFLDEEDRT